LIYTIRNVYVYAVVKDRKMLNWTKAAKKPLPLEIPQNFKEMHKLLFPLNQLKTKNNFDAKKLKKTAAKTV